MQSEDVLFDAYDQLEEVESEEYEKTTQEVIYDSVKYLHLHLSRDERSTLVSALKDALQTYEAIVLAHSEARKHIYATFTSRKGDGKVVSSMSRDFIKRGNTNSVSKRDAAGGGLKKLDARVHEYIYKAYDADLIGDGFAAASNLKAIRLHYGILNELNEYAPEVWKTICEIKDKLFRSVLRMCVFLAKKKFSEISGPAFGQVIDENDLCQEAFLSAHYAISVLNPIDYFAFTTYVYSSVTGKLSNYVKLKSRTVHLSYRKVDRATCVIEAMRVLGVGTTFTDVAVRATKILHDKKMEKQGRKLKRSEAYTEQEVADLLVMTQPEMSLDRTVSVDGDSFSTVGDMMESTLPSPEELVESSGLWDKLFSVIREFCTKEEYEFIKSRWSREGPINFKKAAKGYKARTGQSMHKSGAEIEERVFSRIREATANGEGRFEEIASALHSLD